jgi:hypothetical protein
MACRLNLHGTRLEAINARAYFDVALLWTMFATTAFTQVGGGSNAGPASGAPGAAPSGTAGTSPSSSSPGVGTLGAPGPASGAGIPSGPGPGSTTVVPNIPSMPQSGATVGRDSGGNINASPNSIGTSSGPSRSNTNGARLNARTSSPATPYFNPEAVTTRGLESAARDIRAMPADELRDLVRALNACTSDGHPLPRTGECAKANWHYQATYAKGRQIDRTLREFDRVIRFQNMFTRMGPRDTEYEDRINQTLLSTASASLADATVREGTSGNAGAPSVTRDVSMPTR